MVIRSLDSFQKPPYPIQEITISYLFLEAATMDTFLAFFDGLELWQKGLWLTAVLFLCWALEFAIPLRNFTYRKWRHAGTNFVYLGMSSAINVLLHPAIVFIALWTSEAQFGLLHMIEWPVWAELLVTFALLDLMAQYVAHYCLHNIPLLFRFHRVHHSDTAVDATTATRHHPVDYVVREVLSGVTLLACGAPASYYIFYRMATLLFGYTSHANFVYPMWVDRTIGLVLITPNMHKFHHHDELPWTDTNYGNIFSFWDRLFGTLVVDDPRKVNFGLDIMDPIHADNVLYQLKSPFDQSIKSATPVRSRGRVDTSSATT